MPGKDGSFDLINRDPHNMNRYIEVQFDDVLAEPEGAHSADCVWRNAYKCFNCGRDLCYKILTYLCGICLGLYWGCVFACISFEAIWCWGPYMRCLHITLHPIRKIYAILLGTFLGPLMETLGLFFSRIHVTNAQGQPPKPLGGIDGDENQHHGQVKNFK